MHDAQMLDATAATIRQAAPNSPSAETLDGVLAAAIQSASGTDLGHITARRMRHRVLRPLLAVALVGAALGVSAVVLSRSDTASAFAKGDALAAFTPPAGQVLHAVTRSSSVNPGEVAANENAPSRDEFWIDAAGNRSRAKSIDASTGAVVLDVLSTGGRYRACGEGLLEPIQPGVAITTAYAIGPALAIAVGDYEYIRDSLPEGKVVGEVTRNGAKCWDVRWTDVSDEYGNKLSARALFRIPDYRPVLIERAYPGGATTRWEALTWEIIAESDVPTNTFDVASVGQPGLPEENIWYPKDLATAVDHPVYWTGPKLGERAMMTSSDCAADETADPMFFEVVNGHATLDVALGLPRVYAEYTAADCATVTVSTGAPMSRSALAGKLDGLRTPGGSSATRPSAIGSATVVTSPDGMQHAGIALGDATVVVTTSDPEAMAKALQELKAAR
jgi:hypothetical protein